MTHLRQVFVSTVQLGAMSFWVFFEIVYSRRAALHGGVG